ncbi:MAG: PepSY-associated TM helix domain-containing protein [Alphaproteobacteria bacterium]
MAAPADNGGDRALRRRGRAVNWPRVALLVHNWLGLKLFLILSVVFLSGTTAVFRFEIDGLIYPQVRITPGESLVSLDTIVSAVRAAYPDMGLAEDVPTGAGGGHTAVGIVGISPERGVRMIWVDPYRGVVQGDTPMVTPGFFLAKLHKDLFIPEWGTAIVCATAIVTAIVLVTGLLAYRRFWRGFLRRPRFTNLHVSMVDLHKFVGLWSLWFVIVITATGLWYFWQLVGVPKLGFPSAVQEYRLPDLPTERLEALGPDNPQPLSLSRALAQARERYPDFEAAYVSLPGRHGEPLIFHGNRGEVLAPYATAIAVDPFSGEVTGANLASHASLSNRIAAMVNPLHYGDFGGLLSKSVWFVFGLGLSSLAITGVAIFWCRAARASAGPYSSLLRALHPWRGAMGWAKPLNWAALAVAVVGATMTVQFYGRGTAASPVQYPAQEVGAWRLSATLLAGFGDTHDPLRPGASALAVVGYCRECWDDIRRLWVHAGPSPPSDPEQGNLVQGRPGFAYARLALPADLGPRQRLWLVAEGWDRRIHTSNWPITGTVSNTEHAP